MNSIPDIHEAGRSVQQVEARIPAPSIDDPALIRSIHPDDEMFQYIQSRPDISDPEGTYFLGGSLMMRRLRAILQMVGVDLAGVESFLDFACGYGRFTRFLVLQLDARRITVSDLYREAVDFQKATFGVNGFYSDVVPENLAIEDRYQVVFVASLFSHLPEAVWGRWLKKLYGVLAPGGVLIFSTHGPAILPTSMALPESGFAFRRVSESKIHSLDDYGTSYVSSQYVHDAVLRETGQPVILELAKGLFHLQDVFVVRKPAG